MGKKEYIIRKPDGTPDVDASPNFHCVKCMFDSFPRDNVDYLLEVLGDSGEVILSKSGQIELVDPPWVATS